MNGPLSELRQQLDTLGGSFPAIRRSVDLSERQQRSIREALPPRLLSDDCTLIVFGSTARGEATSGSDVDWTLLIDGPAMTEHRRITQEIVRVLEQLKLAEPRAGGAFGTMAFSHDVIHRIGGESDSNRNLTQRALLLLESVSIDEPLIRDRVARMVLQRYVQDETSFLTETGKQNRIPRFLLNDIVRFWRTMAVDYASKRIERGQESWALRNAKLRFSRKLLFVAGFLVCLSPKLRPTDELLKARTPIEIEGALVDLLSSHVDRTPLAIVLEAARELGGTDLARQICAAYDGFLEHIEANREHLSTLPTVDPGQDPIFEEVRTKSRAFQDALNRLFFASDTELGRLVTLYGFF